MLTNKLGQRRQWQFYQRSYSYIASYRYHIAGAAVLSLLLSITSGLATYSFLPIFDLVFASAGSLPEGPVGSILARFYAAAAGSGTSFSQLLRLVGVIVSLSLVSSALLFGIDIVFVVVQAGGTKRLRKETFKRLISLPLTFHNQQKVGVLMSRIENDIGGTIAMVAKSIADLFVNMLLVAVLLGVLTYINWQLTLSLLPVLVILGLATVLAGRWIRAIRYKMLSLVADINGVVQEAMTGLRVIKAFSGEQFEVNRWNKYVEQARRLEIITSVQKVFPLRFQEAVSALVTAVVLIFGGRAVLDKDLAVADLLLFFLVLVRFQRPANALVSVWFNIQSGMAHAQRTFDLLDQQPESQVDKKSQPKAVFEISIDNVWFSYGQEPVLRGVSFSIKQGESVALVGASGSGKSSIADLLLRFYTPQKGRITLNNVDVREYPLKSYRELFGVVTQDVFLWHDEIGNNISYPADGKVDHERIITAARTAHADAFIRQLPDGYHTIVGDRGVRLSGGQRQRVAIARAVARNPQMFIFDEATSSLDARSEQQVQRAINELLHNKTVFVIAHRLSTIRNVDRILVLHDGKIVESGNHNELVLRGGLYNTLWKLQA